MIGYFEVPKARWQELLEIPDADVPERLIVEGSIEYPRLIERRGSVLEEVKEGWMPNLIIGEHEGRKVGYCACFGGPLASQFVHIYCKLGTQKIIQIGICGGLQPTIELGDVVISEAVLSLDGSARLYGSETDLVPFDEGLVAGANEVMDGMDVIVHRGRTVSYFDILLEKGEDLDDLSREGYIGVEMEAAATGAVSRLFGTPAISILTVSDNSISGKDLFYTQTEEERGRIREGLDKIFLAALDI